MKKAKYYKQFEEVENKKNIGEITFFVIVLLKYLVSGQKYVLRELKLSRNMLDFVKSELSKLNYTDLKSAALFMYAQAFLFNNIDGSIEDREMIATIKNDEDVSKKEIRESLDELEKEGYIKKVKSRPIKRKIANEFLDSIGLSI